MRNLKKLLAVILTVVMIASMMVPALAANTYEDEALKLQAINVFAGGPEDLKLDEGVTRIQGLTFAIRAAGKDAEALAMEDAEVDAILADWTDADSIPAWGRKYAAYAIKNSITVGLSSTEKIFGALNPISGTSFLVFIMKAGMGYADVTTANVIEAAVNAGILTAGQAATFGAKEALIRDDAAGILYGAFTTGVNADGTKLIDAYIASGATTLEDAIEAGFAEEVVPEELEVVSVTAINLQQVEVQFNMAMDKDSAEDEGMYTVSGDASSVRYAELSEDGTLVTLTLNTNLDNQTGKATVTIKKDIKNKDGDKLGTAYTARDLKFVDTQLPELQSVKVTGNKKIEVTYSEPVSIAAQTMSNYKIDNKLFTASRILLDTAKTSRKVEIELSTRLTAGEHTIKLAANKVADLAGLKNIESEITFVVEDVTDAPTAYVVKATTTKVTFQFEREVTKTPTVKFGSTNALSVTQDADDKTKYDAIFATGVIPNAGGDLTIVKGVEDFYGNKTTADLKLPFVPTFDNEKPEVVSITSEKEGEIIVEFSEDIANPASGSFTVKDKDGDRVASITVSYAKTDSGKNINNKALVKGNFKPADGPYTVSIKNVKDLQGNPMVEVTDYEVIIPDKTAPTIKSAVKNVLDNKLAVTFSEEVVGAADIENFKYEISSKGIYVFPSGTSAEMTSNNKSVIFTFPTSWAQGDTDYTITNVNKIYVSGVEDYAGNVMDDIGYDVTASENLSDIKSVKATAKDTIKIEYLDDGKVLPSTLYAGDFIVAGGGEDYTVSDAILDGRTIVLTMADELPGDTTGITVKTEIADDIQGTKTALGTPFVVTSNPVVDKIAPSVKTDDIDVADDGTLVVTLPLTEELDNFDDDAILVKVDGDILANGIDYNAALNGTDDAIEITFENTFDLTMDIVISIPDSAVLLGCYDNGGNALKAMAAETVSFDLADAADGGLDVIAGTVNVDYKISSGIIYLLESYVTGLGADPTIEIVVTDGTDPIDMDGSGKYSYKSFDGNNWTKVENPALEDNVVVDAVDTVETQLVAVDSGVMYKVTYEIRIVTTLP